MTGTFRLSLANLHNHIYLEDTISTANPNEPCLPIKGAYILIPEDKITIFFVLGGVFVLTGLLLVNLKQKNSINKK